MNNMDFCNLDNNIDSSATHQNSNIDDWFSNVNQMYGQGLSDEIISQSVEETCDFFHIDEPAIVSEGWTTGVYPNNEFSLQDDVLVFNREQLLDMGISGKDGLDLVMTHEGTHRMLQGMEHLDFDAHHEELCCDYMAGVRAGLNNIDVSQMENALLYTPESESHPAGTERVESIEAGVRFAQEYFAEYNVAPTFSECIESFMNDAPIQNTGETGNTTLRVDDDITFKGFDSENSNKEWFQYYTDKADHAFDQERIHMESAAKASERGDESAAKDHLARAKSWHSDAEKYLRSAKLYK